MCKPCAAMGASRPLYWRELSVPRSRSLPSTLPSFSMCVATVRFRRIGKPLCCAAARRLSALTNTPALGRAELRNRSALRPRLRPPAKPRPPRPHAARRARHRRHRRETAPTPLANRPGRHLAPCRGNLPTVRKECLYPHGKFRGWWNR